MSTESAYIANKAKAVASTFLHDCSHVETGLIASTEDRLALSILPFPRQASQHLRNHIQRLQL